eukprot:12429428-Karenia_brevis.AAC.1
MVPPTLEQRPRFGFMHRLATLLLGKSGATVRLASSDPALLIDVRMLRARSGGGRITSEKKPLKAYVSLLSRAPRNSGLAIVG